MIKVTVLYTLPPGRRGPVTLRHGVAVTIDPSYVAATSCTAMLSSHRRSWSPRHTRTDTRGPPAGPVAPGRSDAAGSRRPVRTTGGPPRRPVAAPPAPRSPPRTPASGPPGPSVPPPAARTPLDRRGPRPPVPGWSAASRSRATVGGGPPSRRCAEPPPSPLGLAAMRAGLRSTASLRPQTAASRTAALMEKDGHPWRSWFRVPQAYCPCRPRRFLTVSVPPQ